MRLALAVVLVIIGGIYGGNEVSEMWQVHGTGEGREWREDMGLSLWMAREANNGLGGVADVVAFALPDMQGATAPEAAEQHADIGVADLPDAELVPALPYVTAPSDTYTRFFEGYRAGAGQYREDRIGAMIFCESTWTIDPGGYFLGLAQFDPGTWATVSGITGYADPYNPFHQGYNVSVWASMISPGTSAGWPNCW